METHDPNTKARPTVLAAKQEPSASPRRDATRDDQVDAERDVPRMEPWMKPMLWSLVPLLLAIVLPRSLRIPLIVLTGALFVASIVVLLRQSRTSRRGDV